MQSANYNVDRIYCKKLNSYATKNNQAEKWINVQNVYNCVHKYTQSI